MESRPCFGSEQNFHLSKAILLYQEGNTYGESACAATIHDVRCENNVPSLDAGHPITTEALETLVASLGRNTDASLLPESVLSLGLTRMIWWCPGARRRIWFAPSERDSAKAAGLKKLNGKFVIHPALVFCASGRHLRIFALHNSARPTIDTPLYRAPYYNLDQNCTMCAGSAHVPDYAAPGLIPQFEKAFFTSAFSHSSWGHQLTRHPKGHLGLWQDMEKQAKAKRPAPFPAKHLVPMHRNLASLLKDK